jgi:hypothetical protein
MPDPDRRRGPDIDSTDARAGSREGVVRWVLLISLSLAIIALTIIWVTGALTQDSVESEGTSTGRIEAQREAEGGGEGSSIDGINPDVGDSFADDEATGAGNE